jgi:hypothetical protein
MLSTHRSSKLQKLELECNGSSNEEDDGVEELNEDSCFVACAFTWHGECYLVSDER